MTELNAQQVQRKQELLSRKIEHVSLDDFDPTDLIEAFEKMSFSARSTARAARIFEKMIADPECTIILCLAGSLISAGLKKVILQMLEHHMVDAIVSTGANIVDQDFFEALGFRHHEGSPAMNDDELRQLGIDRIYDTLIDEEELRVCDLTIRDLANSLAPRPWTSREFIAEMGRWIAENGDPSAESIVAAAHRLDVPIFCPAFSDCSAGFGLAMHQWQAVAKGDPTLTLDAARDFLELTLIKIKAKASGLLMVGGGTPKNFAQDIVVAAEMLETDKEVDMHRYAVQITVADERDGALSGSTLQEACSWGKVDRQHEQMVFGEATVALPLIAGFAYRSDATKARKGRRLAQIFASHGVAT